MVIFIKAEQNNQRVLDTLLNTGVFFTHHHRYAGTREYTTDILIGDGFEDQINIL